MGRLRAGLYGLMGMLGVLWSVWPGDAQAFSMTGALRVHSALHQPFAAELPFDLDPGEALPQVTVLVARNSDYVSRSEEVTARTRLTAQLVTDDSSPGEGKKRGRILLSGTLAETDPFFTLLLQIVQRDRSYVRNFSVVLDAFPTTGMEPQFPVSSNRPSASLPGGVTQSGGTEGGRGILTGQDFWLLLAGLLLILVWLGWRVVGRGRSGGAAWQMTDQAREKLVASGMMSAFVSSSDKEDLASVAARMGPESSWVVEEQEASDQDAVTPSLRTAEVSGVGGLVVQPDMDRSAVQSAEEEESIGLSALDHQGLDADSIDAELAAFGDFTVKEEDWFSAESEAERADGEDGVSRSEEKGFWSDSSAALDNTFVPKPTELTEEIEVISFDLDVRAGESPTLAPVFSVGQGSGRDQSINLSAALSEEERMLTLEFEPYEPDDGASKEERETR